MHRYRRFWQARDTNQAKIRLMISALILLAVISLFLFITTSLIEMSPNKAVYGHVDLPKPALLTQGQTKVVRSNKLIEMEHEESTVNMSKRAQAQVPFPVISKIPEVAIQQLKENELKIISENKSKQRELAKQLKGNETERSALYQVQISNFIRRWRSAWQAGDTDTYFDSYGEEFVPSKFRNYEQWKTHRADQVNSIGKVSLKLHDLELKFTDDMNGAVVHFEQEYRSIGRSDHMRKQLLLKKIEGSWKIIQEDELEGVN